MSERLLVISDIHGHRKALSILLKRAKYNPKKDQLVLMGDYVNNGPDSFGTLKLVKRLKRCGALALAGNHEMRWLNSKDKKIKRWHPFLRELSAVEVIGNYIFAHAGIDTNKPLNKQIKEYTTGHYSHSLNRQIPKNKYLVHGHVPNDRYGLKKDEIYKNKNELSIDTGAGHNKFLSLIDLTGQYQYSVEVTNIRKMNIKRLKI
ncbi:metallophosphoesterase [Staphylococcus hominis]|uniref:metallophosphoesterase n=1 Tax=Staphylococcus hominis TaxID=1290 RepID=UPI0008AB7504|nr:metallophosphoesterase [Staphylococcus hominis]MCE4990051.1 metallophosphoesterase [Staphylococcus hominis]MDS3865531.1 metallophosphoesterase [Staphylococcus hominis]MDS3909461.1 metallophosphoesterase [Staphylococcus hominis]PTK27220.1 serine/threonine protein phosphatase [Staphylococcus hominis]PTK38951.1 serine/threonine protein phosphatase [Staphylococcus hominis]